jgi:hypothetical protein
MDTIDTSIILTDRKGNKYYPMSWLVADIAYDYEKDSKEFYRELTYYLSEGLKSTKVFGAKLKDTAFPYRKISKKELKNVQTVEAV